MSILISPSPTTAPAAATNHPFRALSESGEGHTFTMLGAPMRIVAGAVHTTVRLIAGAADTMGRFCVFEQETPAGWGPPRHIHTHEDEIVYILEGTYEVSFGDERRTLTAVGCAILPRGVVHRIRNVGPTAGRILCVVTPGGLEELFEAVGRKSIPLTVAQQAEMAKPYGVTVLPAGM